MKNLRTTITINKPIEEVFAFAANPKNTPKWVASVVSEQTNEWPAKLGTIYHNQRKNGEWSEYEVVEFEPNKIFVINQKNDSFHVGYVFTPANNGIATTLDYSVWKDEGELPTSLTKNVLQSMLDTLKQVIESRG